MIKKVMRHIRNMDKKLRYHYKRSKDHYFVEIHVVDHCNLNCKGCSHFSPVADEWFISLEDYEKQIRTAAPLFSQRIKQLLILGGEPLLHPQLEQIVEITRRYFKHDRIVIITNGLLVKNLSESFWQEAQKSNAVMSISKYPCVKNFDDIVNYVKSKNVSVETFAIREEFTYRGMCDKGIFNWRKTYYQCVNGGYCLQIRNGKVYPCVAAAYMDILNKKFGTHFTVDKQDYLVLDDIRSPKEILRFRRTAKKVCKYCDVNGRDSFSWGLSECKRNEWIIDSDKD